MDRRVFTAFLMSVFLATIRVHAQDSEDAADLAKNLIKRPESAIVDVRIYCNSNDIVVAIELNQQLSGMVYPKGLSKNSTCMKDFTDQNKVMYKLPLKSCNTMSTEQDEGIEYFNTIVYQPHKKLVTNQGRGYHIRCKYQTKEKTITNKFNVTGEFSASGKEDEALGLLGSTPLTATAPMPMCHMRLFVGTPSDRQIAENVKIGDRLTMMISLDNAEIYGMLVTDCLVRDGLGWGEQALINSDGCPVDYEILGPFQYGRTKATAAVSFQAHKFPYTDSVYYQCNVKLCIKNSGGCDMVPPVCVDGENVVKRRKRREVSEIDASGDLKDVEAVPDESLAIEVFTGLYVREEEELPPTNEDLVNRAAAGPTRESIDDPDTFCLSPRTFALGIAIAGLILMIAVIAAILILIKRRLRGKDHSTTGSSIYSGPYTNTAYSHSS